MNKTKHTQFNLGFGSLKTAVTAFILALIFLVGVVAIYFHRQSSGVLPLSTNNDDDVNSTISDTNQNEFPPAPINPTTTSTPAMPEELNLTVPFTPQAPTGNWDALHNEACEEASAIMANAFLTDNKTTNLPAAQVEKEITGLTKWQDENLGYHKDSTAAETAAMITGFYGLKTRLIENYSLLDIKNELNLGHIIILPVNGQEIGNPNYKQPGPIYHMLVIRGYNSTGLITNDSGTKRGLNYNYTFNTLYQAGADWSHLTDTIDQTRKVIIVVWK